MHAISRTRLLAGAITAMFCMTVVLSLATSAHAQAPPPPPKQYYLHLKHLVCYQTEDWWFDGDEAYITINGNSQWGIHKAKPGRVWHETTAPAMNQWFLFSSSARVQLYDNDTGIFDKDDLLGTLMVSANVGTNQTFRFRQDGANYVLTYDVVAV